MGYASISLRWFQIITKWLSFSFPSTYVSRLLSYLFIGDTIDKSPSKDTTENEERLLDQNKDTDEGKPASDANNNNVIDPNADSDDDDSDDDVQVWWLFFLH